LPKLLLYLALLAQLGALLADLLALLLHLAGFAQLGARRFTGFTSFTSVKGWWRRGPLVRHAWRFTSFTSGQARLALY
jgi:hypothetical protein